MVRASNYYSPRLGLESQLDPELLLSQYKSLFIRAYQVSYKGGTGISPSQIEFPPPPLKFENDIIIASTATIGCTTQ